MNQKLGAAREPSPHSFTEKQGQYLAFIYTYSHMFRRPPAETDMQRHFQVSPPSVHQMIVTLERNGLHSASTRCRQKHPNPGCSGRFAYPRLAQNQPVIITVPRYALASQSLGELSQSLRFVRTTVGNRRHGSLGG